MPTYMAYEAELHLLYVEWTRARNQMLVSVVDPSPEFLGDMRQGKGGVIGDTSI